MPRRWKAAIFLTTLLAATLSLATFASARTDHVTVLHFTARHVELHFVDVAPTGGPPSPVPCAPSTTGRVPLRGHRPPGPGRPDRPRLGLPAADQRLWDHRGTGRWRNAGGQVVVQDVLQPTSQITAYVSDLGQGHS